MAAESRHKPHFNYTNLKDAQSQRTVRPLGCFYWGEVRTLAAWCEARDDFRSLRVDRIAAMQVLPERVRDLPGKTLAGLFRPDGLGSGQLQETSATRLTDGTAQRGAQRFLCVIGSPGGWTIEPVATKIPLRTVCTEVQHGRAARGLSRTATPGDCA